jgi:hypothetical protein
VALVAVLALSLAAAGLPSPAVAPGDDGVGEGSGTGVGQGSGDGAGNANGGFERPEWVEALVAVTFAILRVLGLLAVTLLVAALVYLTVTRREAVLAVIRGLLARVPSAVAQAAAVTLLALAVLWLWPGGGFPRSAPIIPFAGESGGESTGPTTTTINPDQALALLLFLGVAALAVLAIWRWYSRPRSEDEDHDDATPSAEDADQSREGPTPESKAGEPQSTPTHPVVDAWREMALSAGVGDPRTATPRQVAESAAAAGLDREEVAGLPFGGDLPLLHGLQQRRLSFRRRAIDLVRRDDVCNRRALPELDLPGLFVVDVRADDVSGEYVRRELDARKGESERGRNTAGGEGFARTRDVLDEHVPAREHAEQDRLKKRPLGDDRDADRVEDRPTGFTGVREAHTTLPEPETHSPDGLSTV